MLPLFFLSANLGNMKAWLQGYVDQIEWLNAHPETPVATKATRRSSSAVRVRTERTIYRQRAISDKIKKNGVERSTPLLFYHCILLIQSEAAPATSRSRSPDGEAGSCSSDTYG